MKSKLSIAIASIVVTLALSADRSQVANSQSVELPYVYGNVQFPETKATNVRHTFRLRVPANSLPLAGVKITAPTGLTVNNDVSIDDRSGNKIAATTIINGQTIVIDFTQPVAAGTDLNIDLNRVKLWGTARNYQVAVRSAGSPRVASTKLERSDLIKRSYQSLSNVEFRHH